DVGSLSPVRVSVSSSGVQGDQASDREAAISYTGAYVAFTSVATTLVAGDTNGVEDVFIRDRGNGQTIRANISNGGAQANAAFPFNAPNSSLAFNGSASSPIPSLLAFDSPATNLVFGDTNGFADVFSASISPTAPVDGGVVDSGSVDSG